MNKKHRLNVLYTNIGRGHPYYLDGIIESIRKKHVDRIEISVTDVFEISNGISQLLWRLVRWLYRAGSQSGIIGKLYNIIRKGRNPNQSGLLEKLLARDIRKYINKDKCPTLVAHPILVPMLSDSVDVYYQHGEIAIPDEAIVQKAGTVFIPLEGFKGKFTKAGLPEKNIVVTGLCVEPELAAKSKEYYENRLSRIKNGHSLCGGFFSSGAEPIQHIKKIIPAVSSLSKSDGAAFIYCKKDGRLEREAKKLPNSRVIDNINELENINNLVESNIISIITYRNRIEENNCTLKTFKYLDYFMAPSHERTNWAIGLGLPMFILFPIIGTFSPLNREFMLKRGVAVDLYTNQKAAGFSDLLSRLASDGTLLKMSQNGYGKYDTNGFKTIADYLKGKLE